MPGTQLNLDEAVSITRTGDVWLFRGRTTADRVIRATTNSPVNHVGMSVVIEDLPALIWHAELGRSLPDVWSGTHQRGAQLHELRSAVLVWATKYGQQVWLRQLDAPISRSTVDLFLRAAAEEAEVARHVVTKESLIPRGGLLAGGATRRRERDGEHRARRPARVGP